MKGLWWAVAEAAHNWDCQNISNIISILIISFVFIRCVALRYKYILLGKANYWGLRRFICLSSSISLLFSFEWMLQPMCMEPQAPTITPTTGIVT